MKPRRKLVSLVQLFKHFKGFCVVQFENYVTFSVGRTTNCQKTDPSYGNPIHEQILGSIQPEFATELYCCAGQTMLASLRSFCMDRQIGNF